jgi:stearoyl-CoA desaturase (delta-9 desaturase)
MIEILYLLISTHITIVSVTLFLHRGQAHRGIEFHPALSHFMRLWLWLTTGMVTKEWVAVHRKHHRYSDGPGDPHSPIVFGIWRVLFSGVLLYSEATKDEKMVNQYGVGTPDDWLEKNIYSKYSVHGVLLLLIFNTLIFNGWGIVIWLIQIAWIPFHAAGVINGIGHWFGYRNGITQDNSRNIVPWGIWIGGEELHNNHHLNPSSVKLSRMKWEFDIGWMWLKIFMFLKLASLKHG